jgi:CHAT domain-containing protein
MWQYLLRRKSITAIVTASILLPATAVFANIDNAIQAGVKQYQQGDYSGAIGAWQAHLKSATNVSQRQLLLQNIAQAQKQIGNLDDAIETWQTLIDLTKQQNNQPLQGLALIEQAQVYSALGRPRSAINLLCNSAQLTTCPSQSALAIAQQSRNLNAQAAALGGLGDAYRTLGEYDRANEILKSALTIAQQSQNTDHQLAALNSLGNNARSLRQRHLRRAASLTRQGESTLAQTQTEQAQQQTTIAQQYFQQSLTLAEKAQNRSLQVQARLNQLSLTPSPIPAEIQTIQQLITQLPNSRTKIYSTIDLARYGNTNVLLTEAVNLSQKIQDTRAESFALGELGKWHEQQKDYAQAQKITEKAILAADRAQAKDSRYQWEWQLGRILRAQNRNNEAIVTYETAIATLESIRNDLLAANRNLQFDFRDSVEPIYRELIALRFQSATDQQIQALHSPAQRIASTQLISKPISQNTPSTATNLDAALLTFDSLRLAELQNYFRSDCIIRASEQAKSGDQTKSSEQNAKSAIMRTIVLDDRVIITLSLPNQPTQFASHTINRAELEKEVIGFRRDLETYYNRFKTDRAERFYNWLIQPFAKQLAAAQIDTLVFVNDGILRSIPMAALHDGKQFLVEKYAIAITPSLSLTDSSSSLSTPRKALAAGMSQDATIDGRVYAGLSYVPTELSGIKTLLKNSQILVDGEFTKNKLRQEISQTAFPIIHLATHGQFGAEAEDTFLITGDRQKLSLNQLDELLRTAPNRGELIDLLMLTACETAIGDDRAALGLAGIAIQAGAKSAIASLWSINDQVASEFSQGFYQNLATTTKAKALQQTQIQMIRQPNSVVSRPAYWAAYILVGSWQ